MTIEIDGVNTMTLELEDYHLTLNRELDKLGNNGFFELTGKCVNREEKPNKSAGVSDLQRFG